MSDELAGVGEQAVTGNAPRTGEPVRPPQQLAVTESEASVALLDDAERALALVAEADEAEVLFRKLKAVDKAARLAKANAELRLRAGRLHLRAERRWGELLGPAKNTGLPVSDANGLSGSERFARHQAREVADVRAEIFDGYLARVRDPERLRRARILRLQREWEAEQRRATPIESTWTSGEVQIRHGDLRTVLADLTGRVDAIVTDPPYPAEYLDEFDALGELAARLLRPNGVLVAMVGQAHLPKYLERLERHLRYRWTGAYLTHGPATRIHGRSVGTKWKPLLFFDHGRDERRFLVQDVFDASRGADKRFHDWGQSESGMADIVTRLTQPGELIVDPFLGGGTTAIVCQQLNRRFIGCDRDADAVQATRRRLAA